MVSSSATRSCAAVALLSLELLAAWKYWSWVKALSSPWSLGRGGNRFCLALLHLAWLETWCRVLSTQPWKEESSALSCVGEDRWPLLPCCLRSGGTWASWLGGPVEVTNRQVMGYASAIGKTLVLFTWACPGGWHPPPWRWGSTLPGGPNPTPVARVASAGYSKGCVPPHWCGGYGMLSCPTAGWGRGLPFYRGLGKGCYPPPTSSSAAARSLAGWDSHCLGPLRMCSVCP